MSNSASRSRVHGVPDFWERISAALEPFLILDYDGTLAPFRTDRMNAFPLEGTFAALEAIRDSGRTRLAMLTGRPLRELRELVGNLGIPMVGSHGFERLMPDGSIRQSDISSEQEARFARAEASARSMAPEARVERKPASVGLHTRGMEETAARRLQEQVWTAWSCETGSSGLECRRFSGGVELRLAGINKGTAIAELLDETGNDTLCVYVGDDETDEDAFRALLGSGIGIKVGPPGADTLAQGRLRDPAAVREFLRTWAEVTAS